MGSQQSSPNQDEYDTLPVSPLIQKLRNILKLTISSNRTSSFVNQKFAQQLRKTSGTISRVTNPFCPIIIEKDPNSKNQPEGQENQNWLMCCLVSPVMAIASPQKLLDENGKYTIKAKVQGMNKANQFVQIPIHTVQIIEEKAMCLVILQRPIIELGWSGLTFLKSEEQITNQSQRIINHPKFQFDQSSQKPIFHQEITKAFYRLEEQFVGSFKTMPGSLIVKVIDKKPYIVGVQVTELEGHFITQEIFEMISQVAKKILIRKREIELLRMIDIQELEFMEKLG